MSRCRIVAMLHLRSPYKGANKPRRFVPTRLARARLRPDRPPPSGTCAFRWSPARAGRPRIGRGSRRGNDLFDRAHAPRLSLHRDRRRGCGRRCCDAGAADRANESGRFDHRRRRADRGRSSADRRRPGDQGVLARQADLHQSPHQEADRRGARTSTWRACPTRSRTRRASSPKHDQFPGADRHLHPSRLHPDRASGPATTATSAPATARSTTPPAASGAAPRR